MYPKKTYLPKSFSVWNWIHFLQSKEQKYKEEDYQFLPPYKKQIIQVKVSIPQIHCLKWIYLFQPKKRFATFQKTN